MLLANHLRPVLITSIEDGYQHHYYKTCMTLIDCDEQAVLKVISQTKINKTYTVYNFEVDEFHTYHISKFGVWVHNACWIADKMP